MMKKVNLIFILLVFCALRIMSQDNSTEKQFKWDINSSVGFVASGPVKDILSNMQGLYQPVPDIKNNVAYMFELDRKISNNRTFEICVDKMSIGLKFPDDKNSFNMLGISPVIMYNVKDQFFIGGGPTYYQLRLNHNGEVESPDNKFGILLKTSFKYPESTRIFARLDVQYNYMANLKTITLAYDNLAVYNGWDINMSYLYLGIGIGFRF
jgi:hypothetical protein